MLCRKSYSLHFSVDDPASFETVFIDRCPRQSDIYIIQVFADSGRDQTQDTARNICYRSYLGSILAERTTLEDTSPMAQPRSQHDHLSLAVLTYHLTSRQIWSP